MTRSLRSLAAPGARGRWARRAGETGQAALAMVLGLVMMLVTGGTLLATNAIQHDPLVQSDVLAHYAYRALEAGINSYLNTINAQPNLVNCSDGSSAPTCTNVANGIDYDSWTQVPNTTTSNGNVPEWYLWTNPQFCFSTTKTYAGECTTSTATHNFQYVRILVVGAAGTPGHYMYQSSVASFAPRNGFLTHLWWSNFESAPTNPRTASRTACKYDWANGYGGPGSACTPVYFASGTHVNGPVYSNDSIYVDGTPTFGTATTPATVTTHDPSCIFVTSPGSTDGSPPKCATAANGIFYTKTVSRSNAPKETPPVTDTQLQQVAAKDGCLYSGPTTISFYATATNHKGYMNVTSPETPLSGTHDGNNTTSNDNVCVGSKLALPTGAHGNGVIFVKTATSGCAGNHVNPFEGERTGQKVTTAQISEGPAPYNYTDDVVGGTAVDCEGDAFVRDADKSNTPSGMTAGISGNLTVAAGNNVVITGTLVYADCGSTWKSEAQCTYHPGTVNDSLGLIANNYVEVNRPVKPKCGTSYTWWRGTRTYTCTATDGVSGYGWSLLASCTTTVTDLQAVLCNPGRHKGLVVDAAILDLSHEFTVDNYGATYGGALTGTLVIFGTVDQYWRGPVGYIGASGYQKYYTWDSRLQYVSIPYYLTPGTPSWALASSSTVLSSSCPRWPKAFPTGAKYLTARTTGSSSTGKAPNGTAC